MIMYESSITGKIIDYGVPQRIVNTQGDQIPNPKYDANKINTKKIV